MEMPVTPLRALLIAFAIGLVIGRFAIPPKAVTKQSEVVQKSTNIKKVDSTTDVNEHRHVVTTTTETDKPDGTKVKVVTAVDDSGADTKSKTLDVEKIADSKDTKTKEVVKTTAGVSVNALYGAPVSFSGLGSPVYGASVSKTILGPISVGVWGFTSNVAGVSLGLNF